MSSKTKYLLLTLITGSIVILDQITKTYIDQAFQLHESLPVISNFFSITYVRNKGAAFGLFANQSEWVRTILFSGGSLVALFFIVTMIYQTPPTQPLLWSALALLFGGAIGNITDRIRMGEVIDFLDFYIGTYHWPAFNIADSAITTGVALLGIQLFLEKRSKKQNNSSRDHVS